MSKIFDKSLNFVLDHEGRIFENVDGDPGGATMDGITWRDYNAYRKEHGLPIRDLHQMTAAEMGAVYTEHYWRPMHCDDLPFPVAITLFDSAVNVGSGRVVIWLQQVIGVTPDGGFGPVTLGAVKGYVKIHGAEALARSVLARRADYYSLIGAPGKKLNKFLKGWLNRVADLKKFAGL